MTAARTVRKVSANIYDEYNNYIGWLDYYSDSTYKENILFEYIYNEKGLVIRLNEFNSNSEIINSTFSGNLAYAGSAISSYSSTSLFKTSIIWGNGNHPLSGNVTPTYSVIEGGYEGEGNMDEDPLFTSGIWGDYYLCQTACGQEADSPCLNAGENLTSGEFNHNNYITRTDGVVDTGIIDMGFHYSPYIEFELGARPFKFGGFTDGDEVTIQFDLKTASTENTADIYLLLLDPDGKFWPGLTWDKGIKPLVKGFTLPADLDIESAPIVNFTIPSTKPPVDKAGRYFFYIAALKPGTIDFISNIATADFNVN